MPPEPSIKRAVAFVDGQNLFHAAREAFGYTYPNYDILALTRHICQGAAWDLAQTSPDTPARALANTPALRAFLTLKGV